MRHVEEVRVRYMEEVWMGYGMRYVEEVRVGVPYWIMGVGLYGTVWVCMELCGMVWCGWDVSL